MTRRTAAAALAGALLLGTLAFAHAQWTPAPGPNCPAAPSDPAEARALAGNLFREALTRGQQGAWAQSVELFVCSYAAMPHPNTLFNLGLAAEQAGDLETAENALARSLEEAPTADFAPQAEAMLASVRERLPVPTTDLDAATTDLDAAQDGVLAVADGEAAMARADADLPTAEAAAVDEAGGPATAELSSWELAGWSLLGGGLGVALLGGAVFGALATVEADDFNGLPRGTDWSEAQPYADRYEEWTTAEISLLVLGGAAALAGAGLLLFGPDDETPILPVPLTDGTAVGFGLAGRF